MYNFPQRQKKNPWRTAFGTAILLVVLIVLVGVFRAPLAGVLWRGLVPVVHVRTAAGEGASLVGAQFMSKDALLKQNEALMAELASTSAALADRNALYAENQTLKNRFGATHRGILSGIIARPPLVPYDELVIDAGTQDGVVEGDFVSPGGTLVVGTVTQVYPTTARVTLFSSPGAVYDALLQTSEKSVPISIEGQGMGSMKGTVPAGTQAEVGDTINFAGVAGGFVGTVAAIETQGDQSLKTVYVHEPVDLFSLRYVEVLHVVAK